MFKVTLLASALAIAVVSCRQVLAQEGQASQPEPYSYAYESENHGASESRDPNGKVTGYYTLTDADGRSRRVEYYADETGFHARVQTNEVGTKSESSADVEVQASPPTAEQFVVQASGLQGQAQAQQYTRARTQYSQAAPAVGQQGYYTQGVSGGAAVPIQGSRISSYSSGAYQQPGQGYQGGYQQGGYQQGGYQGGYQAAPAGYGYGSQYAVNQPASSHGYYSSGSRQLSNYNNHLPSQYYKSIQTGAAPPGAVGGYQTASRYSSSSVPIGGSAGYHASRSGYSSSSSGASPSNYVVL